MGGDKVHATVDFHRVGIIENRHAPAYILLWNTVMVLEQGNVRVPSRRSSVSFLSLRNVSREAAEDNPSLHEGTFPCVTSPVRPSPFH